MYPIISLENAMIERIRSAKLPYLRFVGSYGGELLGDWANVYPAVPAIWIAFAGASDGRSLNTARTRFESQLTFTSVVAAYSPRTEAPRTGGPATVGAYQMLTDVFALLVMQDFGLDGVDYLRPGKIRSLYSGKLQGMSLSVFAQDWTSRVQFTLREPGVRRMGDEPAGYLLPEGERLPGQSHAEDEVWLPPLESMALRYWLKPPQNPDADEPLMEDSLTLNIHL